MGRSSSYISQPDLQTQSRHDEISDDQIRAAAENRRPRFHHEAGVWRSEQNQSRCLIYSSDLQDARSQRTKLQKAGLGQKARRH